MNLNLTFELLQSIAVMNPNGFTVNAKTMEPITTGYAVAVAGTQNSFGSYGAAKVVSYAYLHPEINAFGGWLNSENNMYYYDAVIIVSSLDKAIKLGRENGQIAIFNLTTLEEIKL